MPKRNRPKRPKPPTLKQQFEPMRLALIDSWLASPRERRTSFLRRRIGIASTTL